MISYLHEGLGLCRSRLSRRCTAGRGLDVVLEHSGDGVGRLAVRDVLLGHGLGVYPELVRGRIFERT